MNGLILLADGAASAQNLSIFDPASPPAESIRSLSVLVLAITGFIFIVVEGILVYSIVRFRRRAAAGTPFPRASGREWSREIEPPQVYGSKPIEIAWTAAPALIVFVLVLVIDPHPLGGERPAAAASRRATRRSSSRSSAASGGGSTPTTATTAGSWASSRPTSCTFRPARRACRGRST